MLTVDYDRLDVRAGHRVLDLGCGMGRHTFEALLRGADVVACDLGRAEVTAVRDTIAALAAAEVGAEAEGGRSDAEAKAEAGTTAETDGAAAEPGADQHLHPPPTAAAGPEARPVMGAAVQGDGARLPFGDAAFDRVIASEVLEHVPDDQAACAELARVLKPGGRLAVTVPAWWPEKVCWRLSDDYHAPAAEGGHVRIYRKRRLAWRLAAAGLAPGRSHRAHALHSPYWWLRCAVGPNRAVGESRPVRAYHRLLEWDIVKRPRLTRTVERVLNPVLGKSLVLYAAKPALRRSPVEDRAEASDGAAAETKPAAETETGSGTTWAAETRARTGTAAATETGMAAENVTAGAGRAA